MGHNKASKRMILPAVLALCAMLLLPSFRGAFGDTKTFSPAGCDYEITVENFDSEKGEAGYFVFDEAEGVLYLTGDVSIKNASGTALASQPVIVKADCTVTLEGVHVTSSKGPAMLIEAPNACTLVLAEGSVNDLTGARGDNINHVSGGWAGIEVEFIFEEGEEPSNVKASLTITGTGTLNAAGAPGAAGISGSNSRQGSRGRGLYGDITIESGTVNASASEGGAAIGSSNNPNAGTSIGSFKATGSNTWGTITINGGTVTAEAKDSGAGIGGGNHVDSSKIVINGGTVTARGAAGIGCGIGSHKNKSDSGADKGPGYYTADVKINGGTVTASSNDLGAAVGGGMYCDAKVVITGGTVNATGGSRQGKSHHGGAGIGGGYLGHADIEITGGTVTAQGGDGAAGIGSGGSPNSNELRNVEGRGTLASLEKTVILISGGTVSAAGGPKGGAGIGLGTGGNAVSITISGGDVTAVGAPSNENDKSGGAGIGSGWYGKGSGNDKYFVTADTEVTVTGGNVIAIGGWGAAGIGSGAENKMAVTVSIDAEAASVQAYSDGTKFAVDTRNLHEDGTTTSQAEDKPASRPVNGNLLQGTFVHAGEIGDYEQNPEGLKSIIITNDMTGETKELRLMPDGYRSYATDVASPGIYTVYTDAESIGRGQGRYFAVCSKDQWDDEQGFDNIVQYTVYEDRLSDNFYLFPVKTIVVEKQVKTSPAMKNGIDGTLYFALVPKDEDGNAIKNPDGSYQYLTGSDGKILMPTIQIVKGVPQTKAYFVGIQDRTYDVWEMRPDGTPMSPGDAVGSAVVSRITTRHGDGSDNNATIGPDQFSDEVTVINEFAVPLTIEKDIEKYFEAGKNTNGTFVFRLRLLDKEGAVQYEDYFGMSFTEAGVISQTVLIPADDDSASVEVTEVYSAGYEPKEGAVKTVDLTDENTEYPLRVSFENVYTERKVYSSGIVNRYINGTYDSGREE